MPKRIAFNFDRLAQHVLNDVGDMLVTQAKSNMDEVSSGRAYIVHGKLHIASKAGDAANNMTGDLNETIRHEVSGNVLEFGAGNEKVSYAKYLEKGTSKMAARPNYTKAIMQNKARIDAKVTRLFIEALGSA